MSVNEKAAIPGLNPDGIQPSRDVDPSLLAAVGFINLVLVALKKDPKYSRKESWHGSSHLALTTRNPKRISSRSGD